MTWVKICGMTNLEDALIAVDAGADAVGFVFYEKSPRKMEVETVGSIVGALPQQIEKVGVFVEQDEEEVCDIVEGAGLTTVQAYGRLASGLFAQRRSVDPSPVGDRLADTKVILAVSAEQLKHLFLTEKSKAGFDSVLIDSGSGVVPGGTGKTFDWDSALHIIQGLNVNLPVIVAGGLNPGNVGDAIRCFRPFGVDVASGVEARPGKKDPEKVRAFVRAVREFDRKAS
ncbi:MAG TPA: phosphoribosylanthranilate isomerase [Candidatus Sulfotelmatobacter sp.]|nr:phosphoribosylanthranilate isomerase [Candidatus Sulfotelmatobacter sp.]